MNRCTSLVILLVLTLLTGCYSTSTLPIDYDTAAEHARQLTSPPGEEDMGMLAGIKSRKFELTEERCEARLVVLVPFADERRTILLEPTEDGQTFARVRVTQKLWFWPVPSRDRSAEETLLEDLLDPAPRLTAWRNQK